MAYELSWIVPKRVILCELSGFTEEASGREFDAEMCRMLDDGDAEAALIHTVLVFDKMTGRPNLKLLTSFSFTKHPRNGWLIATGITNPLIKMVGSLAAQITKIRATGIDTVEEAIQLLYEFDSTIPRPDSYDASV